MKFEKVSPTWTTSPDNIIHELLRDSIRETVSGHPEHAAKLEMAASIVREYFRNIAFKALLYQDWEYDYWEAKDEKEV